MEQKLLQILKEKGMRMSNLAAKLGMDQSNLSKKLRRDPKLSLIESVANALDVPMSTFFPEPPPSASSGVLTMGEKRFALVPLPDQTEQESKPSLDALELSPGALQQKISSLAQQCSTDGKSRAFYGFLDSHFVVVFHDGANKKYRVLFWESDGLVSHWDYPSYYFGEDSEAQGWKNIQLAEYIVHDIINSCDL